MRKEYIVNIDDNYHYMDESERLTDRSYFALGDAIKRCEDITIESLESMYKEGITSEKLLVQWSMFGEDPFVVGAEGKIPFSARKFITTAICKKIIKDKNEYEK